MAVTEVGSTQTDWEEDVGTMTIASVVVPSGTDLLTLQVPYYNGSGTATITGATFNTTEPLVSRITSANAGGDLRSAILTLTNPTATTANLVVGFSANVFARATVRKWDNVDTTTPTHGSAAANGDSALATVDVSAVVSGEVVLDAVAAGQALTIRSGQTADTGYPAVLITASNPQGGTSWSVETGTVTMDWDVASGSQWATCALAIKEAAGGGGGASPGSALQVVTTALRW